MNYTHTPALPIKRQSDGLYLSTNDCSAHNVCMFEFNASTSRRCVSGSTEIGVASCDHAHLITHTQYQTRMSVLLCIIPQLQPYYFCERSLFRVMEIFLKESNSSGIIVKRTTDSGQFKKDNHCNKEQLLFERGS